MKKENHIMSTNFAKYPSLNLHKERLNDVSENEFIELMKAEDISLIRWIDGRGYCGIRNFIFTTAIVYGIGTYDFDGRYCYQNASEAILEFYKWNGKDDPGGSWVKHKGYIGEYGNSKINE